MLGKVGACPTLSCMCYASASMPWSCERMLRNPKNTRTEAPQTIFIDFSLYFLSLAFLCSQGEWEVGGHVP